MDGNSLTVDRLHEAYLYEPDTGNFIRLQETNSYGGKAKVGEVAGHIGNTGYIRIGLDGRVYLAHRLAWFYMTGEWPSRYIDHINMIKTDNRWSNLRAATMSQNQANTKRRKDNTSGYKGVTKTPFNTWQAKTMFNGKKISLGTYDTPEEAFAAYRKAAEELFGDFHRA